jgi:transcriptional regulator with XRE-family HTH domain
MREVVKIMDNRNQRLSKLLKSKREEMDLNQREMARLLGFRQATLSQWESGKAEPDVASLEKIAKFFGYAMEDFWAYLDGKDLSKSLKWDLNRILNALDALPPSDVATIVSVGAQKLAKTS